jgi:hypothetical protein
MAFEPSGLAQRQISRIVHGDLSVCTPHVASPVLLQDISGFPPLLHQISDYYVDNSSLHFLLNPFQCIGNLLPFNLMPYIVASDIGVKEPTKIICSNCDLMDSHIVWIPRRSTSPQCALKTEAMRPFNFYNFLQIYKLVTRFRAHSSLFGWGTILQAGRSQILFPMTSMEFSVYLIVLATLYSWGWLSL